MAHILKPARCLLNITLLNRTQYVRVGTNDSDLMILVTGSPQGSVISPIFFIILLADIDEWTQYAIIVGFADDNSATVTGETTADVTRKLESDAHSILKFMASNKLLANDSKTTFMLFGKKNLNQNLNAKIMVGHAEIMEQDTHKILGIHVSNDLKWKTHINHLKSRLLQRLYLMRHLRTILPSHTLSQIADGFFNSQIRYGLPIFLRPRLNESDPLSNQLNVLQVIHNEMVRVIAGVQRRDKVNMTKLRQSLTIMSVNQMLCQAMINETRKVIIHDTVPSMKSLLTESGSSNIQTRARTKSLLRTPVYRTRSMEGFAFHASKLYNKLPTDLRICQAHSNFKKKLNLWIVENVP